MSNARAHVLTRDTRQNNSVVWSRLVGEISILPKRENLTFDMRLWHQVRV